MRELGSPRPRRLREWPSTSRVHGHRLPWEPSAGRASCQSADAVGLRKQAVADGDIRIVPERFEKVYNMWLGGIRDWCVSRQLWWGHRIPVWCAPRPPLCMLGCRSPLALQPWIMCLRAGRGRADPAASDATSSVQCRATAARASVLRAGTSSPARRQRPSRGTGAAATLSSRATRPRRWSRRARGARCSPCVCSLAQPLY
jgi:hypothetical protein